jgi:hypothetical protein
MDDVGWFTEIFVESYCAPTKAVFKNGEYSGPLMTLFYSTSSNYSATTGTGDATMIGSEDHKNYRSSDATRMTLTSCLMFWTIMMSIFLM